MGSSTLKILGFFVTAIALVAVVVVILLGGNSKAAGLSKDDVNEIIGQYIKDHPKEIIDSLTQYQIEMQKSKDAESQKNLSSMLGDITSNPNDPIAGNPNGDVTIVEYFDYQCGYCKKVFPYIFELIKNDPNLKVVLKEFPILGPNSVLATKASLSVNKLYHDKYWDFHQKLMQTRVTSKDSVLKIASDMGLDANKISTSMDSDEIQKMIDDNRKTANDIGIRGTPAFIIGDEFVPGAIEYDDLRQKVEDQRRKNKK